MRTVLISIPRLVSLARPPRLLCRGRDVLIWNLQGLNPDQTAYNSNCAVHTAGKSRDSSVTERENTLCRQASHAQDAVMNNVSHPMHNVEGLVLKDNGLQGIQGSHPRNTPSQSAVQSLGMGKNLGAREDHESTRPLRRRTRTAYSVPMFKADTRSWDFVNQVTLLGKDGQWNKVMDTYKEASEDTDVKMTYHMFKATITALSARSRWREARRVMEDMQSAGYVLNLRTFNYVIRACVNEGQGKLAFSIFEEMKAASVNPDAVTYKHLVRGCRQGEWKRALELIAEMDRAGVVVDARTFNSAIWACGWAGETDRGIDILQEMRSREIPLTQGSFSAAISACGKARQWERALALLDEMEQDGLVRNDYCYNAALSACLDAGRWKEALAVLREALSDEKNADTINFRPVVIACAEAGEIDEAWQLVREMRAARRVVTQGTIRFVERAAIARERQLREPRSTTVGSFSTQRQLQLGRSDTHRVETNITKNDLYRSRLSPHSRVARTAGGTDEQKREADGNEAPDASSEPPIPSENSQRLWAPPYTQRKFVQCVNACTNRGRRRGIIHLLRDAMANPELEFTMHMYETVLRSLSTMGLLRQVIGVLGWMREAGLVPTSQCIVWAIRGCGKTTPANCTLALSLLKEMDPPDTWGYAAALSVLAKGRQWKKSFSLLDEMSSVGLQPNVYCYSAIMTSCYRAIPTRWKEVLDLLQRMKSEGVEPNAIIYNTAVRACLAAGQNETARSLVDEMIAAEYTPCPDLTTRVAIASSSG